MFVQSDTTVVDTLTQVYSDKWQAMSDINESGFVGTMASEGLIYVVLGVTLIIWFVLLFYLFAVDRRLSRIEQTLDQNSEEV
jgi:CcmD family protein